MDEVKVTDTMFADMKELWTNFETAHSEYSAKGVKKAAAKSRKAIQALKGMITDYKKASVAECKA